MTKIVWDEIGEHLYETGVKNGVLYPMSTEEGTAGTYPEGYAWNGLTSVSESPEGAEANDFYADDQKYLSVRGAEDFKGSINAYTYPDEFAQCNGEAELATGIVVNQQARKTFGLSYKTTVGNDVAGNDYGYKIHLVYGATVSPSEKEYQTINDSPEPIEFSWEFETTPVNVPGLRSSALITLNSKKVAPAKLGMIEAILYGVDEDDEFDATKTYKVGDTVMYTDAPYVCTTAVTTAGAWSADNWTEIEEPGPRLPLPAELLEIAQA